MTSGFIKKLITSYDIICRNLKLTKQIKEFQKWSSFLRPSALIIFHA